MSSYLIYAIIDPETSMPKYIGSTAKGMKRLKEHFRPCRINRDIDRARWIKSWIDKGVKPQVIVPKTRAEQFELEACLYDVRRAKKRIRELESGDGRSGDQNDD